MSASPNLKLPFIDANQNQKSVTHNAALTILDALVNLQVQSTALAAPPAILVDGQCWIVASGGAGAWVGRDLNIAAWQDGAWNFYAPNKGFVAYVDSIGGALMWNGTAWVSLLGTVAQLSLNAIGIGTAIDPGNPLSAKLNAALFAALPSSAGGTGDVRLNLSKQAAGNTASLLFQDNFSSRAEIGLAGDDDLHIKVSNDGATFHDAMDIAAASGSVSFAAAPTHPSPASGDNSTRSATTAWVTAAGYVTAAAAAALAPVQSVAGRLGAITLGVADVAGAAPLVSPALTGSPTAPTPSPGDASTALATTAFVAAAVAPTALRIAAQGAAGSTIAFGLIEQLVDLSGASTVSTIEIPDRAILLAVSSRTVVAVEGAPSYGIGVAADPTQFGSALGTAVGANNSGVISPAPFYSPTPIVITATSGAFTAGAVRISIHYMLCGVPTS